MTDINTLFPLPWSVGSYGFDIKAANGLHVDEICSASDEDGDKHLAAMICRAVNNHAKMVSALEAALRQLRALGGEAEGPDADRIQKFVLDTINTALSASRGEA